MPVDRPLQIHLFVSRKERALARDVAALRGKSISQTVRELLLAEHRRLWGGADAEALRRSRVSPGANVVPGTPRKGARPPEQPDGVATHSVRGAW